MLRDGHRMTSRRIADGARSDEGIQGLRKEKRDQLSTAPVRNELATANQGTDPAGGEAEDACGFVQIDELSHGRLP